MSDFQVNLINTAGISSIVSFWIFAGANALKQKRDILLTAGQIILALAFAALTGAIILRGIESARVPISNLYESLLWFAWAIIGGYLYISHAYRLKQLGWLAALASTVFFSIRQLFTDGTA